MAKLVGEKNLQKQSGPSGPATTTEVPELSQLPWQQEQILSLQRAVGNRAVGRLLESMPGQGLDAETRRQMEERFHADFNQVQVHNDEQAGAVTRALQARAVTAGKHIAFSPGQYSPQSPDGRRLLAHELAHIVQQSVTQSSPFSPPADGPAELAADRAADQVLHGLDSAAGGAGILARQAGSAPGAFQTKPASAPRSPNKPVITPEIEAEMNNDINFIVKKLANFDTDFADRQQIIARIEKYVQADQEYARSSGYRGSDFLDKFLFKTKLRVFSRKSFRSMWQEEHQLLYDALWHDLYGIWLDKFKEIVALSKKQATSGPLSEAPENPWRTLSKQEAIGVWGTLKGMGTAAAAGLVDAPAKGIVKSMKLAGLDVADPIAAADWLEKQYDFSGEAMFGKDYSQGESLLLGMNAAQIGTAGGKLIWTLVMLGAGKGASAGVKGTLAGLGVLGNMDGIITSATNIANLIETLQKQDKLTAASLLTNRVFLEEVTKLAANIFGAISAGMGTNSTVSEATKATFARVGILLDLAQVSVMVGRLVEITTSDMSVQNKESAAGQVVAELITSAITIAAGAAEYHKEHGKSGAAEEQGKPPPKLLEEHIGEGAAKQTGGSGLELAEAHEVIPPVHEQPGMQLGNIPEEQLQVETTPDSQADQRTKFEQQNELTPETMESRRQKNAPESERAVGSPGTAKHGESESRTYKKYRMYTAAEAALRMRTDYSPEHHGYIRSVEFEVPEIVGNFGTRGERFNQDPLLNEINVAHMTHETLTNTNAERGHAAAQQLSAGDPAVAEALMTTSNIWPMRGRGSTGVNQGTFKQFEEHYIDLKANNPGATVTVRIEAEVGSTPTFITGQDGRQALVPEAFNWTITITPPDGPPQMETDRIPNQ